MTGERDLRVPLADRDVERRPGVHADVLARSTVAIVARGASSQQP